MQARDCDPVTYDVEALQQLLSCRKIAFIGDSVVRNLAVHLTGMVGDYQRIGTKNKHLDVSFKLAHGLQIDFMWRPLVRICQAPAALKNYQYIYTKFVFKSNVHE